MKSNAAVEVVVVNNFKVGYPNEYMKNLALELLNDTFQEEIAHLQLRMIRDAQAPRFKSLKQSHPEIYKDFMKARSGPHEKLLKIRRKRIKMLTALIEGVI